jgi:phosphate transport system substrate-binding protein
MKKLLLPIMVLVVLTSQLGLNFASAQFMPDPPQKDQSYTINADGATFPYPIITKWITEYEKLYPNVQFNYQALGSGTGVKDFLSYKTDFGASDAPMSTTEKAKSGDSLQLPETIGADVISYNMPGIPSGMNITGEILADIYLGKITVWSDSKIQDINPGLTLPNQNITAIHRSDGSGTTYVFTDYLSKVSQDWSSLIGKGKSVSWPTGVGAPQNAGVANAIQQTPYSIGYVELAYVKQNNMTYANIQNSDGTKFLEPNADTISSAVNTLSDTLPQSDGDWSEISITNAQGGNSYPIASLTYFLVHKDFGAVPGMTEDKAKAVIHMINWMVTDGQQFSPSVYYVSLPESIQQKDSNALSTVTFNGTPLYNAQVIPEFGQTVSIILVITILSIIILSYKTKSLRY